MLLGKLRRDPAWLLTAIAVIVFLCVFLLWPLSSVLHLSFLNDDGQFSLNGYYRFFSEKNYRDSFVNTLILGVSVTLCSLIVGGGLAVVAARFKFPLVKVVLLLPFITLVIPDVVVAASWILVMGREGLMNNWLAPLGISLPSLYSWWGLIFVMTLNNYVYAFIAIYVGLKSVDRSLEEAAFSLGHSSWQVMRQVTFPLILPSILAGALIVFTHVIESFGIPAILGARTPVLAVKAYNEFVSEMGGSPQMQTTMASILVYLGIAILLLQKYVVERRQVQMEQGRAPLPSDIQGMPSVIATGCAIVVLVLSLLPALVVMVTAFTPSIGPVLYYGDFTLKHIQYALVRAPEPLYNSLFLATIATVAGIIFAMAAAYLIVKRRAFLTSVLDVLVSLPLTIAGTVFGIALIHTFSTGVLAMTGTWVIMALAYFLRRVPTCVRSAMGPLYNLKDTIEEASMSLGVSSFRSFFKVVLPAMMPSLAVAGVLMWVTTLSELSATIVLYFGGMNTMPIEIFQQVDSGRLALACAYSVLLLAAIFLPLALARWVFRLKIGTIE